MVGRAEVQGGADGSISIQQWREYKALESCGDHQAGRELGGLSTGHKGQDQGPDTEVVDMGVGDQDLAQDD